jgi:SAM-dependent methyltransferase
LTTALAFASAGAPARSYGDFFSRLRWRRAVRPAFEREVAGTSSATEAFAGADLWVVVLDLAALPVGSWSGGAPAAGRAATPALVSASNANGTASHTIRELESSGGPALAGGSRSPALLFRAADFAPSPGESAAELLARVDATASPLPDLFAFVPDDPSSAERPELSSRIPSSARRLLDAGCGSGATSAAIRARIPGLVVTGLEIDPGAARRAEGRLDRVLVGDAGELLATLAAKGERFDAFLMGDVLEHTADPVAVLAAARSAAAPGATLVASVPNVAHLSIVRDLLLGRFDPAPAGLADAGHLRWFTRSFLSESLEEAGWAVDGIDASEGAAPREAEAFEDFLLEWPAAVATAEAALRSLRVYQWIAVARAA